MHPDLELAAAPSPADFGPLRYLAFKDTAANFQNDMPQCAGIKVHGRTPISAYRKPAP
jgi:hypothetical protein